MTADDRRDDEMLLAVCECGGVPGRAHRPPRSDQPAPCLWRASRPQRVEFIRVVAEEPIEGREFFEVHHARAGDFDGRRDVITADEIRALNTDLRFMLDQYAEAKELVADLRGCNLPADLADRVETFWAPTTGGRRCSTEACHDVASLEA